jgi:hypothetical protein
MTALLVARHGGGRGAARTRKAALAVGRCSFRTWRQPTRPLRRLSPSVARRCATRYTLQFTLVCHSSMCCAFRYAIHTALQQPGRGGGVWQRAKHPGCLGVRLSVCLPARPFVGPPARPPPRRSVCLSVCLSIRLSVRPPAPFACRRSAS